SFSGTSIVEPAAPARATSAMGCSSSALVSNGIAGGSTLMVSAAGAVSSRTSTGVSASATEASPEASTGCTSTGATAPVFAAAGATALLYVNVVKDRLPDVSPSMTSNASADRGARESGTSKVPSAVTTPLAKTSPSAFMISTEAPASPRPDTELFASE